MHFNKIHMHRMFLLLILYSFNNEQIHPMQNMAKTKQNFDLILFQQQLNNLPKDIQKRCIEPFFQKHSPRIVDQHGKEIDTETILIDYRLIPAILSRDCIPAIQTTLWSINFSRRRGYYRPGRDLEIYQMTGYNKIMSQADMNFLEETQFIRNNRNVFLAFGYSDKIKTYIHASHANKIARLTSEQLSFILDLFKAQTNVNKSTLSSLGLRSKCKVKGDWRQTKIILNEAQARLFYSLPLDIQRNLKMNYRLAASTKAQLAVKAPRISAGLSNLSRAYTQYDHKTLVRLAKIAMKAGLVYYGLKWTASSNMLQGRNEALLGLLKHKNKFIIGTAALIGAKDTYGSNVAKYVNRKVPVLGRWARKANDFLTLPLR